ncbi:MAG: hypothetical protein K0Q85_1192 [Caproiciproducens sp.]|jgi:hypothetical protein|nr:hypothetical protein [Caproiciproducens sp.]
MEGNYNITMTSPLGPQKGSIGFHEEDGKLNGSLNIMGGENPFTGGKANGSNFEFAGTLKKGFSKFDYTARGNVSGDELKATAITKFGILQISGVRA